jgi:hypothetical protein
MKYLILLFLLLPTNIFARQRGQQIGVDSDTVGLWHFNTGENTTAFDVSGNNNDGTLNGNIWVYSPFQSALEGDGSTTECDLPVVSAEIKNVLFMFWFNADSIEPYARPIDFFGEFPNVFAQSNVSKTIRMGTYYSDLSFQAVTSEVLDLNKWTHMAFIIDIQETTSDLMLYVNGELQASSHLESVAFDNLNNPNSYLYQRLNNDRYYDGRLEEIYYAKGMELNKMINTIKYNYKMQRGAFQ